MWDLQTIIRENNRAAVYAMMEGQKLAEAHSPQPETWPLTFLAEKLRIGPPLLDELMAGFVDIDSLTSFLDLIRNFLPDHEEEIMGETRSRRVYKFCYLFDKRYYPLPSYVRNYDIKGLVEALPVDLLAMSYDMYHDLDLRKGYLLLLSLVVYPYEGDERDLWDDSVPFDPDNLPTEKYKPSKNDIQWVEQLVNSLAVGGEWYAPMGFHVVKVADRKIRLSEAKDTPEVKETIRRTLLIAEKAGIETEYPRSGRTSEQKINAARVPLLDAVKKAVGGEIAKRIPGPGWLPDTLHRMTDGTAYDGVGHFADWVCSCTGCVVLDCEHYNCEYMEGFNQPLFKWTTQNVRTLTKQWPKVKEYRQKIDRLTYWLEADLINHFAELLDFLIAHNTSAQGGEKVSWSVDPFENFCPLDAVTEYEEEEEEDGD